MNVGNLADLAAMDGMPSAPSIARLIAERSDFPIVARGSSGKAYQLDLEAAAAFIRLHWRDGRNERRRLRLQSLPANQQLPLFEMEKNDG